MLVLNKRVRDLDAAAMEARSQSAHVNAAMPLALTRVHTFRLSLLHLYSRDRLRLHLQLESE